MAAADSGIWELPGSEQFTQSKIACWSALQRAVDLAGKGHVPDREAERWRRTIDAIEDLVDRECWSEERQAYTQCPGSDKLDAAELLCSRRGHGDVNRARLAATVDAIRGELGRGPLSTATAAGSARKVPSSRARFGSARRLPGSAESTRLKASRTCP